jgi:hypothetical protein
MIVTYCYRILTFKYEGIGWQIYRIVLQRQSKLERHQRLR